MPLADFWTNVRAGALLVAPTVISVPPSSSEHNKALETSLRNAALWLTPKTVAGYREEDFDFLPQSDRKALREAVEAFLQVALQVPPTGDPTRKQVEEAFPCFRRIVELVDALELERYPNAEAYRLGKQIENLIREDRPEELVELLFQAGPDHTGDPAIWIWAILTEDAAEDAEFRSRVRELLKRAARFVAPERWPCIYIYFRTVSEQKELAEARRR